MYSKLTIPGLVLLTVLSCTTSDDMKERNKEFIVKSHDELFKKGNLSFADEIFLAEYTFPGENRKGPELIKEFVGNMKKAFPDLQYELDQFISDGNMVSWRRTSKATHSGDIMGYKATGKSVTWHEYIVTQFTDDGKIAQEWGASDLDMILRNASGIEGEYEYVPPLKGHASIHNGQFIFVAGPVDGSQPIDGKAGTYVIEGDNVKSTFTYSTVVKDVGTSFAWSVKSWSGDTLTYVIHNEKSEPTGGGRAVRISH
jgi:predicted ester cyclase